MSFCLRLWIVLLLCGPLLVLPPESRAAAQPLRNQEATPYSNFEFIPFAQEADSPAGSLVAAGIFGGVVGFFGGAAVGYQMERTFWPCMCDEPGFAGLLVGSVVGTAIAIPLAVHFGNDKRGSLIASLGASALIGTAVLLGLNDGTTGPVLFFGAPVGEWIVSVLVEQATGKRRGP